MLATALPPVFPAPVAAPAPNTTAGDGNGPESFARMLDAADARRPAQTAANKAPEARPAQKIAAEKKEGTAADADSGSRDPVPAADERGQAEATATATDVAIDAPLLIDATLAGDAAALLAGLAVLPRPPATDATARTAAALGLRAGLRSSAAEAVDDSGADTTPRGAIDALSMASTAARRVGGAAAAGGGADKGPVSDNFTQVMRQVRAESGAAGHAAEAGTQRLQAEATPAPEAKSAAVEGLTPGAALLAPGATPGATPGGATAAVGHARLAASPGSPEFASQLGAQLTTFVREGVQHARLELHPLELGPVTVQIAIDGTQARVNLAAEHATTRQALEQAMPALAGSLREAGLTLSGGGVFEQPRQSQPDGGAATAGGRDGSPGRGERGDGAAIPGSAPAVQAGTPLRRRGVVDLVA